MCKDHWITSDQITATKETHFYVYADDWTRKSYMGQAEEAADHSNSCALLTKKWKCTTTGAYYDDCEFEVLTKPLIDRCIAEIRNSIKGRRLVVFPKIGQGQAELPQRAPKTFAYIQQQLKQLEEDNMNAQPATST